MHRAKHRMAEIDSVYRPDVYLFECKYFCEQLMEYAEPSGGRDKKIDSEADKREQESTAV